MDWHARHGDRDASRLPTRSQGNPHEPRCVYSIFEKQFVKIAHAIQQKLLWMLGFDAQELLHHGRVATQMRQLRREPRSLHHYADLVKISASTGPATGINCPNILGEPAIIMPLFM